MQSTEAIYRSHLEVLYRRRNELVDRIANINDEIVRIKINARQDGVNL